MTWTHDHCHEGHIAAINEKRCREIVALHACTPPCPRKRAALKYLAALTHPEVLV